MNSMAIDWVPRSQVVEKVRDKTVRNAIQESASRIQEFQAAWKEKKNSSIHFMVAGLVERDGRWCPTGVLVEEYQAGDDRYIGRLVENVRWQEKEREVVSIDGSQIIDWHYFDLAELQGGALWQTTYKGLNEDKEVRVSNMIYLFGKESAPPDQTTTERELLHTLFNGPVEKALSIDDFDQSISLTALFPWGGMPLHRKMTLKMIAISYSPAEIVEALFEHQKIVPTQEFAIQASRFGRVDVIQMLYRRNVPLDVRNSSKASLLYIATSSNRKQLALWLISQGVDVNTQDNGGRTPLHLVHDRDVAIALLDAGADVSIKTSSPYYPWTPIEWALDERVTEVLDVYADRGLLSPEIAKAVKSRPSIEEEGAKIIQQETGFNADEFVAGVVLPFDFIDPKTGRIGFYSDSQ